MTRGQSATASTWGVIRRLRTPHFGGQPRRTAAVPDGTQLRRKRGDRARSQLIEAKTIGTTEIDDSPLATVTNGVLAQGFL